MPPKRKIVKKESVSVDNSQRSTNKRKKIETIPLQIPIDKECKSLIDKADVYVIGNVVYDVMLNQTNLQHNNNKFYLIQLLKHRNKKIFYVWMRWARVGKIGQTKLAEFDDNLEEAKKCFCQKFYDKTKNEWESRANFVKVCGKYDIVHIDYSKKENVEPIDIDRKLKLEIVECKLEPKVQDVMRMVFDIKEMNSAMAEMNYDSNKVPLGQLNKAQVKAGYKALREIEGLLNEGYSSNKILIQACNTYYTRIPHDFGMRTPPLIQSISEIKRELELLEALSDIQIALNLIGSNDEDAHIHPLDRNYNHMNCEIKSINPKDNIYQVINDFLHFTHASTHSSYKMELVDLFEIRKELEWAQFKDNGNRMLLWHGSRTTNYGGIFAQGLRMAPPEAPVSGHMFGKGIYFADMSSKSANYIYATKSKNVGFLLLCEVSLGTCNELIKANARASKMPRDCHSVKGLGMTVPDSSTWREMDDGVVIPVGMPIDSGLSQKHKGYLLNYNEYIVYNQNQIKLRYLVKVQFHFK